MIKKNSLKEIVLLQQENNSQWVFNTWPDTNNWVTTVRTSIRNRNNIILRLDHKVPVKKRLDHKVLVKLSPMKINPHHETYGKSGILFFLLTEYWHFHQWSNVEAFTNYTGITKWGDCNIIGELWRRNSVKWQNLFHKKIP